MMIVVATKEEIPLVEQMGFGGEPIIITGVGGTNVIKALKHLPEDTEIVNIGYAGSNVLPIGTVVDVGYSRLYHENVEYTEDIRCLNADGVNYDCYTSTDFVVKTKIKEPCVFDMELAFICAMFKNVRAIKVVSDNLSVHQYEKTVGAP